MATEETIEAVEINKVANGYYVKPARTYTNPNRITLATEEFVFNNFDEMATWLKNYLNVPKV